MYGFLLPGISWDTVILQEKIVIRSSWVVSFVLFPNHIKED